MSGLAWVRLDTSFPRNHKFLQLLEYKDGRSTGFVYLCALAYCGEQGTDGYIPRPALTSILHGRLIDAERLVDVGLWKPHVGGWEVNDWDEYQQTTDESKARSARAKAAAQRRWSEKK